MHRFKKFVSGKSPQALFLWLAIPSISIFILIIPALQGWDETTHFLRAYQVSTGDFISERLGRQAGGLIPDNISDMNDTALRDLQASDRTNLVRKANIRYYGTYLKQIHPSKAEVDKVFSGSAVYSPISYAPQSLGIYLARTLRLPLLSYVFIGRIFNAAFFVFLVYWAIRLAPRGKWVLAAIAMLPTSLTAASTLSPDAIVNGAALLLMGVFLKGLLGKDKLQVRYLLTMAAAVIVLSLTKETYFILAFLILLWPPSRVFGSIKRYLSWNVVILAAALGLSLLWFAQVGDVSRYSYLDTRANLNVNPLAQQSYIIHQPLHYLSTLSWEIFGHFNYKFLELVGLLTWKGILMPQYVILVIYVGLILSFLVTRREDKQPLPVFSKYQRFLAAYGPMIIGVASLVLIYTGLYLYFSTVKETEIEGVQGRYFIPLIGLLLPVAIITSGKKPAIFKFDPVRVKYVLAAIFIFQTMAAIFVITATNYIPHMQFV